MVKTFLFVASAAAAGKWGGAYLAKTLDSKVEAYRKLDPSQKSAAEFGLTAATAVAAYGVARSVF